MPFRIGIENNHEGHRSAAWALQHPGCFAYGTNTDTALAAMPDAIQEYATWISNHGQTSWINTGVVKLHVDEVWDGYNINEDYELCKTGRHISAFFRYEWKPLNQEEIKRAQMLLNWSRSDLLSLLSNIGRNPANSNENIDSKNRNLVDHIAETERHLMEAFEITCRQNALPKDSLARLRVIRARLLEALPKLENKEQIVGMRGELWSPRKLLRHLVWHERDHVVQLQLMLPSQSRYT